ncbi:hypothetical protein B0A55_05649 [Friedmanniomyces simplex]|uniref:Uncharacterized protein n=1 Tax=Friedmanniomyces simplex TaxID=329884 RepID=A0A4U0XCR5_9PEZI|nr:hypothetical protein B0A55_05649 [Friedmanniomyces simplex]
MQIVRGCDMTDELHDKNILITGCSSGLGIEMARALYETGAQLFLTARDMPKLHSLNEEIVTKATIHKKRPSPQAIELHLDSLQSVPQTVEDILTKAAGKLDTLILNGGVMAGRLHYTAHGFENQLDVNYRAAPLLFHRLQPALLQAASQRSASGSSSSSLSLCRVIILSSGRRRLALPPADIYTASAIDRKFASQGIRGWSVHPGGIVTGLACNLQGEDFQGFGDVGVGWGLQDV